MPPEAKVFLAEDDLNWQANYASTLLEGGHTVVGRVTHVFKAANAIYDLKESGIRIDVAIVDGNIGFSDRDGAAVIDILKREFPTVKVIGATTDPRGVEGADININKREMNPGELADIVTRL
jgi:hypothetical protein